MKEPVRKFGAIEIATERLILKPISPLSFARQTLHWTKDRQAMSDLQMKVDGWTFYSWWRRLRKLSNKNRMCHGIWLKHGDKPVGIHMALMNLPSCDVGTGILIGETEWRGKGIAAEAKTAVVNDLFQRCHANRVTSWVHARNFASIHTMHKVGFTREAVMRQQVALLDGTLTDHLGFGLLRSEWQQRQSEIDPAGRKPGQAK